MNRLISALRAAMASACLVLAGCASEPAQAPQPPAPLVPPKPAAAVSAVVPAAAPAEDSKVDLPPGAAKAPAPFEGQGWESMFDGQSLAGWKITPFSGRSDITTQSGVILMRMGDPFNGLNYTNEFPKMNYEIAFDAMRVMGTDFFCGLTVPVDTNFCSLIVGGWGGGLVGVSSINGMDASENETTKFLSFESGRWYRIRLRVTQDRLEGWIDDKKVIDAVTKEKRISLRPGEIEHSIPIGLACWQTSAAFREIKWRHIDTPADPPKKNAW